MVRAPRLALGWGECADAQARERRSKGQSAQRESGVRRATFLDDVDGRTCYSDCQTCAFQPNRHAAVPSLHGRGEPAHLNQTQRAHAFAIRLAKSLRLSK
jgi:hypothetical protein